MIDPFMTGLVGPHGIDTPSYPLVPLGTTGYWSFARLGCNGSFPIWVYPASESRLVQPRPQDRVRCGANRFQILPRADGALIVVLKVNARCSYQSVKHRYYNINLAKSRDKIKGLYPSIPQLFPQTYQQLSLFALYPLLKKSLDEFCQAD